MVVAFSKCSVCGWGRDFHPLPSQILEVVSDQPCSVGGERRHLWRLKDGVWSPAVSLWDCSWFQNLISHWDFLQWWRAWWSAPGAPEARWQNEPSGTGRQDVAHMLNSATYVCSVWLASRCQHCTVLWTFTASHVETLSLLCFTYNEITAASPIVQQYKYKNI